jgi:ubiquinone/menaquinone biosynthesis C-methylase UbiE
MGEKADSDAACQLTGDDRTARVREYYDEAARSYDSWMVGFDRVMLGRGRSRMCSRARGPTLEVAVGTGGNLPFYPPDVQLTGVDLSPAMLAFAERRAQDLALDVELEVGDAERLEFPDERFETVTATLLMSTVPSPQRAAEEMWRVLRVGGRLLILDFARSPVTPVRWVERALAPLTARSRFSLLRDPLEYIQAVGFTIEHVDRFRLGVIEEIVARKTLPLSRQGAR